MTSSGTAADAAFALEPPETWSVDGEFVVRPVAMDLTAAPEPRNAYGWPDAVPDGAARTYSETSREA